MTKEQAIEILTAMFRRESQAYIAGDMLLDALAAARAFTDGAAGTLVECGCVCPGTPQGHSDCVLCNGSGRVISQPSRPVATEAGAFTVAESKPGEHVWRTEEGVELDCSSCGLAYADAAQEPCPGAKPGETAGPSDGKGEAELFAYVVEQQTAPTRDGPWDVPRVDYSTPTFSGGPEWCEPFAVCGGRPPGDQLWHRKRIVRYVPESSRPVANGASEDARVCALEEAVSDLQRSRPLCCYDCGRRYEKGPDLVVSNEDWNRIAPREDGGGVLCPNCMHDRFVALGAPAGSVRAQFKSGPFADDLGRPAATGSKARAIEVMRVVDDLAFADVLLAAQALDRAKFFADEATLAEIDRLAKRVEMLTGQGSACDMTALALATAVRKLGIGGGR